MNHSLREIGFVADGNMISGYTQDGKQFTATYDYENRLTSIKCNDGSYSAYFTYDSNGYISKEVVDGVTTTFVRDGYTLLQERDGSNNVTCTYLWNPNAPGGIGGLLEMKTGSVYYDYLYDGKGNVDAVVDDSNNIQASYAYDPFGNLVLQGGTLTQPFMFSTKPYFSGFGLYDFGNRFYLPLAGKWLTMDPMREKGGSTYPYGVAGNASLPTVPQMNLYQFAGNNVVNCIDPYGLWAWGLSIDYSTINPWSSSAGGVYGWNLEYTSDSGWGLYKYSTPDDLTSNGFLPGVAIQLNIATGNGDWTGPFDSSSGSYAIVTGGSFQTPLDQPDLGYFGLTGGLSLGLPGIGQTEANYQLIIPGTFINPPIPDASTYDANQMQDDENYGN